MFVFDSARNSIAIIAITKSWHMFDILPTLEMCLGNCCRTANSKTRMQKPPKVWCNIYVFSIDVAS